MKFTYNPRIIKHLGTELITSDEIAITELIKNSYDAKAKRVNIHFLSSFSSIDPKLLLRPVPEEIEKEVLKCEDGNLIIIEDNGTGMSYDVLKAGFFEIGSTFKRHQKDNQKDEDEIILGDKGIGRLSAQRLGPIMFVETTSDEDNEIYFVKIEWDLFLNNENANSPEWEIFKQDNKSYTRLWFLGNKKNQITFDNKYFEEDNPKQLDIFGNPVEVSKGLKVTDELQTALSFLHSPFEQQKSLLDLKIRYDKQLVKLNFHYDTLKIAESIHSFSTELVKNDKGELVDVEVTMKMDIRPWFIERIHQTIIGKNLYRDLKLSHKGYREILSRYARKFEQSLYEKVKLSSFLKKEKLPESHLQLIVNLMPLEGKIFSFKRDNFLLRMAVDSALENNYIKKDANLNTDIRTFLDANNGIKLYRNQFRIGTVGNTDNDWLQLQQKRTSGQQFYRFELGNVIGYIKVSDPRQEYIWETSSREHLTGNAYVHALQELLDHILDIFSPGFTKRAVEITKDILDDEKLVPKNDIEEIKNEVNKSDEVLKAAKENIKAIQKISKIIKESIDLDSPEKRNTVKEMIQGLADITTGFEQNIEDTTRSFQNANKILLIAESKENQIKTEAYNNYKLMANGLVTEVITHELHSLLSTSDNKEATDEHIRIIKEYLFQMKQFEMNKIHLAPVKEKFDFFYNKMSDLERFYSFIEKTFLYKGNSEDLEKVQVKDYLSELKNRFDFRLAKNNIELDYSAVEQEWMVPKGSLLHIFYNLIDNSIYWIQERQRRAKHDSTFKRQAKDRIVIDGINKDTIQLYDTGTGVLDKYQDILFHPLESGKEEGRGMGLYIVRNFLRSFGGEIELRPEQNEFGNRYIFEISIGKGQSVEDEQ
jgi:signal transduction histidine kinase